MHVEHTQSISIPVFEYDRDLMEEVSSLLVCDTLSKNEHDSAGALRPSEIDES